MIVDRLAADVRRVDAGMLDSTVPGKGRANGTTSAAALRSRRGAKRSLPQRGREQTASQIDGIDVVTGATDTKPGAKKAGAGKKAGGKKAKAAA